MPKSSNLSLNLPALPKEKTRSSGALRSPPISPPYQSPHSPNPEFDARGGPFPPRTESPHSPITALPQPQPPGSPKMEKSRGIFSSSKFSKSQTRLAQESPQQSHEALPSMSSVYQHGRSPGSTPELSLQALESSSASDPSSPRGETASQRQLVGQASVKSYSEPHLIDPNQQPPNSKDSRRERPNKNKFGTILSRTKSTHREESPVPTGHAYDDNYPMPPDSSGLRTAPLEMKLQDKGFREMMRQSKRNRSADRAPPRTRGRPDEAPRTPSKERRDPTPTAAKDLHSGHFFQNIRNSKSKASDLGKAGKGLFGKLTRSGSSHDRENGDGGSAADIRPEDYEPSIMRLPIIEQTRKTRISKRLEDSRDKTEFWLPALPWRCIDYLNMKGTEVEGLYRLSGSKKEMVMWQRRFEMEGDVDLLAEQELYDVNVVASLLKDWLRNIPDEIFPRSTQKMIADMCPDAANLESCPKIMQDELSRLPPFNYYLLFAITCHLSLLTSCFERTKMDFDNLCVCIQPSLGLDRFTFRILIRDWRNCWQGCWTEKDYLAVENDWIANQANGQPDPRGWTPDPREPEGRTLSSAGSNNASMTGSSTTEERPERPLPKTIRTINPSDNETTPRIPRKAAPAHPNHTLAHDMTPTRAHPQTDVSYDQRTELSPLKPLSPMVFP